MAVEYIDSPNAGFIKLGEGVGLETITPQRKRKVKRGDRGVFPITPTGAESYEETDFTSQQGFTTPASAIPNVFDRYKDLPGGARAGGFPGGSFEDVISPGIGNQNDDANDDDDDLEEELRRQTLDIDPVGDYDLSRFDPSAPNFDPTIVGQQAYAEVLSGNQDFLESVNRLTGLDSTTPTSAIAATATFAANQQLQSDKSRLAALIEKTKGSVRDRLQKELDNVNAKGVQIETANDIIGKRGAAPSGDLGKLRSDIGQILGSGTPSTEIPKVGSGSSSTPVSLYGPAFMSKIEQERKEAEEASTARKMADPVIQSRSFVESEKLPDNIQFDEIEIPDFVPAPEARPDFNPLDFKRDGGKISFMNIKK